MSPNLQARGELVRPLSRLKPTDAIGQFPEEEGNRGFQTGLSAS